MPSECIRIKEPDTKDSKDSNYTTQSSREDTRMPRKKDKIKHNNKATWKSKEWISGVSGIDKLTEVYKWDAARY